jgi:hypothetical protein
MPERNSDTSEHASPAQVRKTAKSPESRSLTANDQLEKGQHKGNSGAPRTKGDAPQHQGGDGRSAQSWGGGNKASKGGITKEDRDNENSSAKS